MFKVGTALALALQAIRESSSHNPFRAVGSLIPKPRGKRMFKINQRKERAATRKRKERMRHV